MRPLFSYFIPSPHRLPRCSKWPWWLQLEAVLLRHWQPIFVAVKSTLWPFDSGKTPNDLCCTPAPGRRHSRARCRKPSWPPMQSESSQWLWYIQKDRQDHRAGRGFCTGRGCTNSSFKRLLNTRSIARSRLQHSTVSLQTIWSRLRSQSYYCWLG